MLLMMCVSIAMFGNYAKYESDKFITKFYMEHSVNGTVNITEIAIESGIPVGSIMD